MIIDASISAQDALDRVFADGSVVTAIAQALPFALFLAVLLWLVYTLGLGAGRTIGRLERVA